MASEVRSRAHWLVFGAVAILVLSCKAFPALYGDEYGSLHDADNLQINLHAVGYFAQLRLWKTFSGSDYFLRILSLTWTALGLHWLRRWLTTEQLPLDARRLILLLAATNAFLWLYAVQVRFYSFFLASAILATWRFRTWQQESSRRNVALLILSIVLLCTAHLFGWIMLGVLVLAWLWERLAARRWLAA